ncbi:glycosyltransferase [Gammaproteobacteria bacterium]|nr:glycosyltransferase [Gammaproteobacteria bacterium]
MKNKIDVLIPVYNSISDLRRSLMSISISTAVDNLNVIIVDNNSEDDIQHLVSQFNFSIEYHKNHFNIGRIPNWNRALELISSEWFMFLFAGDELNPDLDIHNAIKSLDNANHIIFPFNMKGKKSNSLVNNYGFNKLEHNLELRLHKFLLDCKMPWGPLQTHIFNASSSSITKFDETNNTHADVEFVFSVLSSTNNVSFYPRPLFTWVWSEKRYHNQIDLHQCIKDDYKFTSNKLGSISKNYSKTQLKFNFCLRVIRFAKEYPLMLVLRLIISILFIRDSNAD